MNTSLTFKNMLLEITQKTIDIDSVNETCAKYFDHELYYKKDSFRDLVRWSMSIISKEILEDVFKLLDNAYKKLYTNNSTIDSMFSKDIRSPISRRFGIGSKEHISSKNLVKLAYEDKKEVKKNQANSLAENHKNIEEFSMDDIKEIVKNNKDSDDPIKVALVLLLSSGSRPSELFDPDVGFEITEGNWVRQDFLRKKRGEFVEAIKPIVFITAQEFLEKLTKMRESVSKRYNGTMLDGVPKNSITKMANSRVKQMFKNRDGITMYSCRKIYSQVSYLEYSKNSIYGDNPTQAYWSSRVLGHGSDEKQDLSTQIHYNHFKIIEKLPKPQDKSTIHFEKIKEIYDLSTDKPNQTALEVLCKGVAPRSAVRLWYQTFVKNKL